MKLERAIELKNYAQILAHLKNGTAEFQNISLIHLIDELENQFKDEKIRERLLEKGAILTYEQLQKTIAEQQDKPYAPEQKKTLKRLYTGLFQLKQAWQQGELHNKTE